MAHTEKSYVQFDGYMQLWRDRCSCASTKAIACALVSSRNVTFDNVICHRTQQRKKQRKTKITKRNAIEEAHYFSQTYTTNCVLLTSNEKTRTAVITQTANNKTAWLLHICTFACIIANNAQNHFHNRKNNGQMLSSLWFEIIIKSWIYHWFNLFSVSKKKYQRNIMDVFFYCVLNFVFLFFFSK